MLRTKSTNYDKFRCIADKCPENCCGLWQIVIDDESIEKYKKSGEKLFLDGIDWEEGVFLQTGGKCIMQRADGLCKIQAGHGEEMLCETCRRYPRHIEEFPDEREYSLSLSCPEAARIIIENKDKVKFESWEDEEEDEEFEEFDYLLYDRLCEARDVLYRIIQDRSMGFANRLGSILKLAGALQDALDDGDVFGMDDILSKEAEYLSDYRMDPESERMYFSKLFELEELHDDWEEKLISTDKYVFEKGGLEMVSRLLDKYSICAEQILMFFVYTYFKGAVYDEMIYSKIALSVYSLKWIFMLFATLADIDDTDALIKCAYTYAREIEHSDINLDELEEFLDGVRERVVKPN